MKQIIDPHQTVMLVIGNQSVDKKVKYRPLNYVYATEVDDGLLLANLLTSEVVLLNNYEKILYKLGEYCNLDACIIKNWFIVPPISTSSFIRISNYIMNPCATFIRNLSIRIISTNQFTI